MSTLDKNKLYCPVCNKEIIDNKLQCSCQNERKFKYSLQWCNSCNDFTSRRGLKKEALCCSCSVKRGIQTQKQNDPEGYISRQQSASKASHKICRENKTGIYSPEVKQKIEETKRKNGTDLGNPEFRKKIGCNGNPPEIQEKLKKEKRGIYSDKCLQLKTERFNKYWETEEWKEADKIRKQEITKNQWTFESSIECNSSCEGLKNRLSCDKNCLKNIYGWCKEKQIEMNCNTPNFTIRNKVRYYKDWEINDFYNKIKNNELDINNFPGIIWRGDKLCYYTEDIINGDIIKLTNSNFQEIDGVRYFKGMEVEEFSSKILSGELNIEDYPGINIRCGRVCYGTEDILTSEKILMNRNFVELNGVKFYKNIEIHEFIRQLDAGETEIPPGFNKRFGEWYCNAENILTGEMTKLENFNFTTKDNILYYHDKNNTGDYIPWEEYKSKFSRKRITKDIQTFVDKLKSLEIFQPKSMGPVGSYNLDDIIKIYPTFRTQDSDSWSGAKGAFEQSLLDNNISWFTYIKFYIDAKGVVRPLVVGKSGSYLVNSSGSDVSFSMDVNDGPSRRFINEVEGASWDKSQILIIKSKSESQAYFYEYYIRKTFDLFES